jgi:hypothetical protein
MGVQGGKAPMAGGCGGCPPTKPKEGASSPLMQPRHEWDPKRRQTLSPRGWANGGSRGQSPHGRGLGGCPPTKPKEGASSPLMQPRHEWDPKRRRTLSPRGWANGGPGGKAPWRGVVGGVPPQNQKKGRVALSCNPATNGTQNAGEPSAYRGGQMGGPGGRSHHGGGLWGVSPQKFKRGGELPTLATPPRVGPKTPANLKPTGVGKRGSRGRSPLAGGCGG